MNVLLISRNDWANVGFQYSKSLKSIGVDAIMLIMRKHKFNYPEQGILCTDIGKIEKYVNESNIIHFLHSQYPIPSINLKGKKVVVSHTGSKYKKNYKKLNTLFNSFVDLTIVGSGLYGKGAKNEHWIPGGVVDTNLLQPVYERSSDKIIIDHFPSNPKGKGSDIIQSIFKKISGNYEFNYSDKRIKWSDNMERIKKCDVYIERFAENTGFGIAAIEAAALGKIVIATYAFEQKYKETTGEFGFISVRTRQEMIKEIERIISLPDDKILELKKKSRGWAEKYHSYEAVGNRLMKLYKSIL